MEMSWILLQNLSLRLCPTISNACSKAKFLDYLIFHVTYSLLLYWIFWCFKTSQIVKNSFGFLFHSQAQKCPASILGERAILSVRNCQLLHTLLVFQHRWAELLRQQLPPSGQSLWSLSIWSDASSSCWETQLEPFLPWTASLCSLMLELTVCASNLFPLFVHVRGKKRTPTSRAGFQTSNVVNSKDSHVFCSLSTFWWPLQQRKGDWLACVELQGAEAELSLQRDLSVVPVPFCECGERKREKERKKKRFYADRAFTVTERIWPRNAPIPFQSLVKHI